MKNLAFSKKVIFAIFAVLFTYFSWGQTQDGLTGEGTSDNPWQIGSAADWTEFATNSDYWDGYVMLTSNIPNATDVAGGTTFVSEMLYADEGNTAFSGNFNGNNKTLTFSYTAEDSDDVGIAPFYYLDGATVRNLTIDGAIYAKGGMVAGLAYYNYRGTINNVTIGLDIIAEEQYWCGGFAYESDGENYTNCIYNGKIVAGSQCCGFTVTAEDVTFSNCLFDPEEGSSIKSGKVFGEGASFSTCYYTDNLGITSQGTKVYYNPTEFVGKKVSAFHDYCTPVNVAVAGVDLTYSYDSETNYYSVIMSAVTVTSDDPSLTTYSVSIHDKDGATETVTDKGDYAVVVTGYGNYTGSFKKYFYVVGDIELQNPELPYNATTNPYVITSAADWIKLSDNVSNGIDADKSYKLTANISVSDMVGTSAHPFSGTFNGRIGDTYGLYTIEFNYGTAGAHTDEEIVAPFRYTEGATIEYLQVEGAIHTDAGKEAGLIGVNTRTSTNTTVQYVIVNLNLYCYESLWEEEGGGFAYDGRGVTFNSCAYKGYISANNYQGGFCGNGDSYTTFENCLFNPEEEGLYWAENFVYNEHGETPIDYSTCYYTEGNNQEVSEQGHLVYVGSVPPGSVGRYMTTLYGQSIYEPVEVVVSGVSGIYIYTGSVISVTPNVSFDGVNAISSGYCSTSTSPSPVQEEGEYTLYVTGQNAGTGHNYSGTLTKIFRVVKPTYDWIKLQDTISNHKTTITLYKDYTAELGDAALTINRNVTINLNGHTIDRGLYNTSTKEWGEPEEDGQVIRISKNCTVVINGPGKITGGYNKAKNYNENSDNDGGGINNLGTLTLNNVTVVYNKCVKRSEGTSRTARGGGIYSGKGSSLTIVGGDISYNESEGGGGGIFAQKATFSIDKQVSPEVKTRIHSNKSLDKGGGIRVDAAGTTANIRNCVIESNSVELHDPQSASNGGGIHLDDGTLNLNECTINNNSASKYGGGIYILKGRLNAKDCSINNNSSYDVTNYFEGYGGGVCIMGGKFYMDGGTVTGNSSNLEKGGGIFVNIGTTFSVKGNVNISGNWMWDDNGDDPSTNVYLKDKSGVITIESGFDSGSFIGVAKDHYGSTPPGVFTKNLTTNGGTVDNFMSDEDDYQILPADGEAKLDVPAEIPSTIDPENPPAGITYDEVNDEYVITEPFSIDDDVTIAKNVTFSGDGSIVIEDNGILYVPTITNDDPTKLIIENHGQIVFTGSPGDIVARIKKDIIRGYDYGENWYLISSAINTPTINPEDPSSDITQTNLVTSQDWGTPSYDLYRFNEAVTENEQHEILQWENYRSTSPTHEGFSVNQAASKLQNGRGYLYRNYNNYTIIMEGYLNVPSYVDYALSYSGTNQFKGFHLIGNPYPHDIYKNDEYQSSGDSPAINNANLTVGYYELLHVEDEADTWTAKIGYNNPIKTGEGILVQTTATGTLRITNTTNYAASYTPSKGRGNSGYDNIMFEVSNNKAKDIAYAMFSDGIGLNKINHLNENTPMLYIHHNNEDYAIATMSDNTKQFNLNFEAKNTGKYTLTVNPQGNYSYLHLIDKVAEEDIDLLEESEYSFIGSPSDNADRFVVRLETSENAENPVFAYQSGNEIVVCGEGELQVFDVMGRLVMQKHVNGVESVDKPMTTGVYILRLNENSQKIVIR